MQVAESLTEIPLAGPAQGALASRGASIEDAPGTAASGTAATGASASGTEARGTEAPRAREARLAAALAVSFALHAALLVAGSVPGRPGQGGTGSVPVSVRIGPVAVVASGTAAEQPASSPRTRVASGAVARHVDVPAAPQSAAVPESESAPVAGGPLRTDADTTGVLAEGAVYLPSSIVDRRAAPAQEIELDYPPEGAFAAGYVVLRLLINERGTVDIAEVLVSDPEGRFDEAALRAFRDVRYRPAEKAGVTVKTEMIVEVKFDPPLPTPGNPIVIGPR